MFFYLSPTETFHRVFSDLTKYVDDLPQSVGQREETVVPGLPRLEVLEVTLGPTALPQQVASQLRLTGREGRGQQQEVIAVQDLPL